MQMRDLEYFAIIAEHRHVGRAAEKLGLSQPAASKCLRRLETALSAQLVIRTPKGIELTAVGSALYSHVKHLRASLDDVIREAADLSSGNAGHLRVGAGAGMGDHFVAAACSALLMEAPKVTVELTVQPNAVLLPALRDGQFDVVLSGVPHPEHADLVQERLYEDNFIVYCSRDHRLAGRKRVALADVASERWALSAPDDLSWRAIHRIFQDAGLPPPRVAFQTTAPLIRVQAVASSDLLSFASRRVLRPVWKHLPLAQVHVKEVSWRRCVGISVRKNAYLPPAAHRFLALLRAAAADERDHRSRSVWSRET